MVTEVLLSCNILNHCYNLKFTVIGTNKLSFQIIENLFWFIFKTLGTPGGRNPSPKIISEMVINIGKKFEGTS